VLTLQSNVTLTVMTARRGREMPREPGLAADAQMQETT